MKRPHDPGELEFPTVCRAVFTNQLAAMGCAKNDVSDAFQRSESNGVNGTWRKRVGVEPTIRPAKERIAGFEGREDHRTLFAPADGSTS